ncbi:cytochrome P450 [Schizophyllum amplum]|uniref:Cytochrome P450 n=1 Tax=Schizophyllum amplum TaxID=97359 RepID=A0A550CJ21_9AGAR|nr:cytochrome P450 [Auriculariopsis ampla]
MESRHQASVRRVNHHGGQRWSSDLCGSIGTSQTAPAFDAWLDFFPLAVALMDALSVRDGCLVLLASFIAYKAVRRALPVARPLPPGPTGYPLLGNVFDMPKTRMWETFKEWGQKYGPIVSVTVLGQVIVVLDDPKVAEDLLGKRGQIYSDRPTMHMAELSGYDRALSNSHYGPRVREWRKLFARVIGTREHIARFNGVEEYQAAMFINRMLAESDNWYDATRKTFAALVLHLAYGYRIEEDGIDPMIALADQVMKEFSEVATPGAYAVDFIPALKYLPDCIPGTGFKQTARAYKKTLDDMGERPIAHVREELAKGAPNGSFVGTLLRDEPNLTPERLFDITWAAAAFYSGGAETSVSVIQSYFLAVCKYPEVQAKAQAELDSVLGHGRLPTLSDRDSFPYIGAICKELCRWIPVAPLAFPHCTTADDIYDDYLIPKGSMVFPNVWKFLHDPDIYESPSVFKPERFLGADPAPDPREMGFFGYGRRQCPGSHLADASVWMHVAHAVAALDISKAINSEGNPIEPSGDTDDGLILRPLPFACNIRPRSSDALRLIQERIDRGSE